MLQTIVIDCVSSQNILADGLTKQLMITKHNRLHQRIGIAEHKSIHQPEIREAVREYRHCDV